LAGLVTWTLFIAKSYVLFAFLFGYSLTLLLSSVERRGLNATRVYRNRLLALLLFGVVHAVCFFVGDILVVYAILGPLLFWLRRKPDRTVWRSAAALCLLQLIVFVAMGMLPPTEVDSWSHAIDASWRHDGLLAATAVRAQVWPFALGFVLLMQGPLVASLFCVGLLAGRQQWLTTFESHRAVWQRVRRWGIGVGLPVQLACGLIGVAPALATDAFLQWLAVAVLYLAAPILSAGYLAAIVLLPSSRFTRLLETDGRMSLSIYIGESVVMTTLAA
jgi:uncharacterized protein